MAGEENVMGNNIWLALIIIFLVLVAAGVFSVTS